MALTCITSFTVAQQTDAWQQVPAILEQIKAPVFPDKDFPITQYGAIPNSRKSSTDAFKKAIEACSNAGGGRVIVPAGTFHTGAIYLKSNVNLHLEKDAKILFSTNPNDYLPIVHTRWEGTEVMNYSPLVYAYQEKNIAITGEGVLDGQASYSDWWPWKGGKGWIKGTPNQNDPDENPALLKMAEDEVPVQKRKFGQGYHLRPQFVQPYRCDNILIEGVTFINSPMWNLTPVLCNNITIRKVRIEGEGPNTDGCDPESCKNVWIRDCYFNTGDDCIAVKSGRNKDGRLTSIPCENIVIQGCTMANGHGGVSIGSETSGGVKNLFAEDCKMSSPNLDRVLRIKSSPQRGGTTENIYMRNIEVGYVKEEVIVVTMYYQNQEGNYLPTMRNIEVSNLTVEHGGKTGVLLEGYPTSKIEHIKLQNVTMKGVLKPYSFTNASDVTFDNVVINGKRVDIP
ncbi:family 28 glycoside hydrolase [Russula earlei]|uniref:Family 28 glycoside hydrolase n=1 Tax=Russula earlei TaxID=71964 RepID=A0ACC0TSG0_9AGAM|nr:family 28 glycoside hydrolase [Russula earlei]